jgi:hypothetical protein
MCKEKQIEMMFGLQVSSGALHCELLCDPVNAAVVDRSTAGPKVQDGSGAESRTSCICNIETSCYRLTKDWNSREKLLARLDCVTTASYSFNKKRHCRYEVV